jgi:hypothetical protein
MKELKTMKRKELLEKIKEKDLIAINNPNEKVHVVWHDNKYGIRICRPSMINMGTYSRDERDWEILDKCKEYKEYESKVKELGREICKHCLELVFKAT